MAANRHAPDYFARRAKAEGKPARSIYKLEEIDKRWKLIKRGDRIIDLGCAPGSWLQYAAQRVGPAGRVWGYDLKPLSVTLPGWASAEVGDVFEVALPGASYNVVLSDMAPSTMGDHKTDAARSAGLCERAFDLADHHLAVGGHVVVKLLEGGEVVDLVKRLRQTYTKVERLRPQATRKDSTEIFLIGLGKKAPPDGLAHT
jgi:23S rRNA (uridine2552-2'-O)-methyltransferase